MFEAIGPRPGAWPLAAGGRPGAKPGGEVGLPVAGGSQGRPLHGASPTLWVASKGLEGATWGPLATAMAPKVAVPGGGQDLWGRLQGWGEAALAWLRGQGTGPLEGREILRNPRVSGLSAAQQAEASARLAQGRWAEARALAQAGPEARQSYGALSKLCAQDPAAALALQRLLLGGQLLAPSPSGGSLLAALAPLAQGPLTPGLERASFVADLIEECADPLMLAQGGMGTCVATSLSMGLVAEDPAAYGRMVVGLAGPSGEARTPSGALLRREPGWAEAPVAGRSASIRLLMPSLMEFANGWKDYDAVAGHSRPWAPPAKPQGLVARLWARLGGLNLGEGQKPKAANRLAEALFDRPFEVVPRVWRWNREAVWAQVKGALAQGERVPVGLAWDEGGHKVLLVRVEGGFATYLNPWGQEERLPEATFKARLRNANLPA